MNQTDKCFQPPAITKIPAHSMSPHQVHPGGCTGETDQRLDQNVALVTWPELGKVQMLL